MRVAFFILLLLSTFRLTAQDSLNVTKLWQWNEDTLVASSAHNNTYNEVFSYAEGGNEYAIIGSTYGTHIFDITDLDNVKEHLVPGGTMGTSIVHRDYKTYQHYLYMVCDEGLTSTLQIADMSYLPDSVEVVYDSNNLFSRAHDIFIDTVTAKLYTCGGNSQFNVYSLADPENPTFLLDCDVSVPFWNEIGYVHDAYVDNDTAFVNAGTNGLFMLDFSNTLSLVKIGSISAYEQSGYNHSGWLAKNRGIYAMADETHGKDVKIVDVSDPQNINITAFIGTVSDTFSIPHNLIFQDNILYISYYFDGLYIYDVNNPNNPTLLGYYDTSIIPYTFGAYRGAWGVNPFLPSGRVLISDMQRGLFVFDVSQALSTREIKKEESEIPITIMQNPIRNNTLKFATDGKHSDADYFIYTVEGKLMSSGRLRGMINQLDLHSFSDGFYIIQLSKEGESTSKTFIKSM